jgi:Na+/melibiose symporter-like transporter
MDNLRALNEVTSAPKLRRLLILVLLLVMTPGYGSAFNYYFTEYLKFDAAFMGQIAFMSALAYLFGIFTVNTIFSKASFKNFYTSTTIISAFFSGLSLLLIFRINVKLGISD